MTVYTGTVSERVAVGQATTLFHGTTAALAERTIVGSRATSIKKMRLTIATRLAVQSLFGTNLTYHTTMKPERMRLRSVLRLAIGMTIREHARIQSAIRVGQAVTLRERVRLAEAVKREWHYAVKLGDGFKVRDKLRIALGGYLHEYLRVADAVDRHKQAMAAWRDQLVVGGEVQPLLQLVVMEQEGLVLTHDDVVSMIYRGLLEDELDFFYDVLRPGGSVTTWATNARTGSTTEYLNYDFNSYAEQAGGGYLAASEDGLYELVGDSDAGDPIVADLIGGLNDYSEAHFTSFKAAYIAVRGRGQFYLKLSTGDGKSYVYSAKVASLRTQRINFGKGLRARYFTWELVSTGQDFDLLGLDFLPIAATRRV